MLKRGLQKQGISILEQNPEIVAEKKLLFETKTILEMDEFIKPLNKYSDNFRAELLALLLTLTEKNQHTSFKSFKDSMPITGKTGTLKNRFKGTVWENTFYGKPEL